MNKTLSTNRIRPQLPQVVWTYIIHTLNFSNTTATEPSNHKNEISYNKQTPNTIKRNTACQYQMMCAVFLLLKHHEHILPKQVWTLILEFIIDTN